MPVKTQSKKQPSPSKQARATADELRTKSVKTPPSHNNEGLPGGWRWVRLGEVAHYLNGRGFKKSEWEQSGLPIIRIQNLNKEISSYNYTKKIFEDRYRVRKGDLLFAWAASLGTYIWKGDDAWLNQHIFKIVPKNFCDKHFLYYSLEKIIAELYAQTHGSGMVHVTKGKFENTEIPLPPLNDQHAIVSKIEELLSELDKGKQQLETAQQQLKVYRQAVLKWAFEGKLTNKDVKEGELPEGWKWIKIDSLLSDKKKGMATGPFGTMLKKSEHQKSGVPVLGIENIGEGVFQMPNNIFITNEKAFELKNFRVKENDIIISRSGTVGEICLLPKKMEGSIISTNLIRVSLDQNVIHPSYFVYLFQGGKVRQQVFDLCKGSSRVFLNQTILNSLDFPYCSVEEQKLIVQEIESRLSVCDKVEETITTSLQQAETLRQSILKKAFEGRLV